ncbi:MAG TPA: tryptophan 2,3-dioxygenase family protein [Chitinophagaceae bacterium]|nr:tryptophan 2,3-dioxygenase family protein [Chitinophagaceae bacterium]
MASDVHYHDYLQLDRILQAQAPESTRQGRPAHDEMLFIIIHQTYELWFKQLLYETDSVLDILKKPVLNDNSPELQTVVHRMERMIRILQVLVHQVDILDTMTPMDFLDFRDMLRPASGFQSWQFKMLEARLGLKFEQRHGQEYYLSQLRPAQVDQIRQAEQEPSLLGLVNAWLERMPFFAPSYHWGDFAAPENPGGLHPFWAEYRRRFAESLAPAEQGNLAAFENLFIQDSGETTGTALSREARRAALFILLYRGYPVLHLPFQLLDALLEIDVHLSSWRYRHVNMVQRMIGARIGTGGSSGKGYLKEAADRHYIFREVAQLNSYLIERSRLPALPAGLEARLGFVAP